MTTEQLVLQGVQKSFAGRPVLKDVTLVLRSGEVLGLVGPSGSGKSTLARVILGIEPIDSGQMTWHGDPLPAPRSRSLLQRIQYVWQEPRLALSPFATACQAVAEPLEGFALCSREARAGVAAQWLARVGLQGPVVHRRPDGLSGGQCQRVAIARALAAEPELLMLDEPFSALDSITTVALVNLLQQLLADRRADQALGVLLISHDRSCIEHLCHRSLCLKDGVIATA